MNLFWLIVLVVSITFVDIFCSRADPPTAPKPDPIPCNIVEAGGVYEIFVKRTTSAPDAYMLFKNYVVVFDTIFSEPGNGKEERFEVPGTYKQGDVLEAAISGSRASMRFAFHANE